MSKRAGTEGPSQVYVRARCTEAEREEFGALAEFRELELSALIRLLLRSELTRAKAEGWSPPRRTKSHRRRL